MLSSIYLTGASIDPGELSQVQNTAARNSSSQADWRTFAMTRLTNHGLKVINPLELPWTETEFNFDEAIDLAGTSDQRVRRALELIDQSDGLLANIERANYGTAMEIFYAHRSGKLVTVFGAAPFSPWVASHSQARFNYIDLALRYIIGNQPRSAPVDWAIHYESQLAERYEQMPPYGEPDYKFMGGQLPILVLAPHATAFFREGEFQEQESFTGAMAALMNRRTGCHTLSSNYCLVADPCYYQDTPFKAIIKDVIKNGQVGLVFMLMGATWQEAPGLQISFYGESKGYDFENRLRLKLGALEEIGPQKQDDYIKPLAGFIAEEMKVPVLSVRMSKRYRMPRLQGMLFNKAADSLTAFLTECGAELSTMKRY
ncbi:MAG: hypothetical protein HY986_11975 [Candidatus Melainabacteria bacterium]|nr:hypothetical protein [Candidatus Melainabacteria bacterium]